MYCSRACKLRAYWQTHPDRRVAYGRVAREKVAPVLALRAAQREAARQEHQAIRQMIREAERAAKSLVACRDCGQVIKRGAIGSPRKYCDPCGRKRVQLRSKTSRRLSRKKYGHDKKHTERARRFGVPYVYGITLIKVGERDRWKCHLCQRSTPKRLRGLNRSNSPEIDHIIPLSVGGAHTWDNVACCCRACNASKAARPLGQMRLTLV